MPPLDARLQRVACRTTHRVGLRCVGGARREPRDQQVVPGDGLAALLVRDVRQVVDRDVRGALRRAVLQQGGDEAHRIERRVPLPARDRGRWRMLHQRHREDVVQRDIVVRRKRAQRLVVGRALNGARDDAPRVADRLGVRKPHVVAAVAREKRIRRFVVEHLGVRSKELTQPVLQGA